MDRLRLTLATWDYDRVRPLIDGSIQPEGIELAPIISRPSETFFRMLRHQEFDVSELSFPTTRCSARVVTTSSSRYRSFRRACSAIRASM